MNWPYKRGCALSHDPPRDTLRAVIVKLEPEDESDASETDAVSIKPVAIKQEVFTSAEVEQAVFFGSEPSSPYTSSPYTSDAHSASSPAPSSIDDQLSPAECLLEPAPLCSASLGSQVCTPAVYFEEEEVVEAVPLLLGEDAPHSLLLPGADAPRSPRSPQEDFLAQGFALPNELSELAFLNEADEGMPFLEADDEPFLRMLAEHAQVGLSWGEHAQVGPGWSNPV